MIHNAKPCRQVAVDAETARQDAVNITDTIHTLLAERDKLRQELEALKTLRQVDAMNTIYRAMTPERDAPEILRPPQIGGWVNGGVGHWQREGVGYIYPCRFGYSASPWDKMSDVREFYSLKDAKSWLASKAGVR